MTEIQRNMNIVGSRTPPVWIDILKQIWEYGDLTQVIYDGQLIDTIELIGIRSQIQFPSKGAFPDGYIWKPGSQSWEDYKAGFISKSNAGFEYTYGERLRSWGAGKMCTREGQIISLDQLDYIIRELRRDPSSRRASAVTWVPPHDETIQSPPCMMSFQALIRKKQLHAVVTYRSHDMFGAYPANAYGLSGVMEYIADHVDISDIGSLTLFSQSAHIYWFNWPEVAKLIKSDFEVPYGKRIQVASACA